MNIESHTLNNSSANSYEAPPLKQSLSIHNVTTQENDIMVANFSLTERKILQEAREKIRSLTKRRDRGRLAKNAETSILSLPENQALKRQEREALVLKTRTWLAAHAQVKKTKKSTKKWTARNVLYELKSDVVIAKQKTLFDTAVKRGENPKGDFIFFQLALSQVWDSLSVEDKESHRLTAEKWNLEGPQPEMKPRLAEKYASKKISAFAHEMWISMGVRILFFASFKRENGNIACTQLDFNDTLGEGKSYISNNTAFNVAGITSADWVEHNRTYYEPDTEVPVSISYRPRKGLMNKGLMNLQKNKYGEPILPDPALVPAGMKRRAFLQNLLRAFLSLHYELASGNAPKIPWSKLLPVSRKCINEAYIPDEELELLKEPSEMREREAFLILGSLYRKQEKTNMDLEAAFRFCHYISKDGKLESACDRKLALEIFQKPSKECNNQRCSADLDSTKGDHPQETLSGRKRVMKPSTRRAKGRASQGRGRAATLSAKADLYESSGEESGKDSSDHYDNCPSDHTESSSEDSDLENEFSWQTPLASGAQDQERTSSQEYNIAEGPTVYTGTEAFLQIPPGFQSDETTIPQFGDQMESELLPLGSIPSQQQKHSNMNNQLGKSKGTQSAALIEQSSHTASTVSFPDQVGVHGVHIASLETAEGRSDSFTPVTTGTLNPNLHGHSEDLFASSKTAENEETFASSKTAEKIAENPGNTMSDCSGHAGKSIDVSLPARVHRKIGASIQRTNGALSKSYDMESTGSSQASMRNDDSPMPPAPMTCLGKRRRAHEMALPVDSPNKQKRPRREVTPPPLMTGKRVRKETWKQKNYGKPVKGQRIAVSKKSK